MRLIFYIAMMRRRSGVDIQAKYRVRSSGSTLPNPQFVDCQSIDRCKRRKTTRSVVLYRREFKRQIIDTNNLGRFSRIHNSKEWLDRLTTVEKCLCRCPRIVGGSRTPADAHLTPVSNLARPRRRTAQANRSRDSFRAQALVTRARDVQPGAPAGARAMSAVGSMSETVGSAARPWPSIGTACAGGRSFRALGRLDDALR